MIDYQHNDGGRAAAGYRGSAGDCVVRAIAIASGQSYQTVYAAMAETMHEHGYARTGDAGRAGRKRRGQKTVTAVQDIVLRHFGFRKVKLPRGPRPTYTQAHARYGTCVVSTTGHMAALKDGALQDTHDGRAYDYGELAGERKAQSVWVPTAAGSGA